MDFAEPVFAIEFSANEAASIICKQNSTCSLIIMGEAPIICCANPQVVKLPFGWYYTESIGFTNKNFTHSGEYATIKVVKNHF